MPNKNSYQSILSMTVNHCQMTKYSSNQNDQIINILGYHHLYLSAYLVRYCESSLLTWAGDDEIPTVFRAHLESVLGIDRCLRFLINPDNLN